MSGHTPGPWTLDTAGWPLIINGPGDEPEQPSIVALIHGNTEGPKDYYSYPDDVAEANARLMTAAPELLAALQNTLELLSDRHDICTPDCTPDCVVALARAAIKKAGG